MTVITKTIEINSKGENDMVDIIVQTLRTILKSKLGNGIVTIFVSGSTAAITTIEYEPGLRRDFPKTLNRIIPKDIEYKHDETWHDGNGHSHVRASLIGPSLTVHFKDIEPLSQNLDCYMLSNYYLLFDQKQIHM